MYEKEYNEIETKLNNLKNTENADPYDVKKNVKIFFIFFNFFIKIFPGRIFRRVKRLS